MKIFKFVPNSNDYSLILRFLGTTPASSNIINVLNSIIFQISRIFSIKSPKDLITEKPLIVDYLLEQFMQIKTVFPNRKLIIILDSIDQLNSIDYDLMWFIDKLPDNVKMIYSTLPDHGGILKSLRKYQIPIINYIEIKNLKIDLSLQIINDWLTKANRSLSDKQWECIRDLFQRASLYPLFISLIFGIISKWSSFDEPSSDFLECLDMDQTIVYLFRLHEMEHGKMLFSRALIYMSAFKNGISENEIEDILSLDDDVLYDIFEFHAPPIRKLPSALVRSLRINYSCIF